MKAVRGYVTTGSREMVEVGAEALAALPAYLEAVGDGCEVAEIRIYENLPIEAVVTEDHGFHWITWTREAWVKFR